ncbi:hypothetical protein E2C01_090030 [Portunus trituberculatus]|uniref:Uncharacterized protein n=1 Tax=Portunus trituberculatus TaxID=210409 RepID=A0A5B7JF50_PORTR|nr:hypothetical protein [Portunus trituberculatus]
MTRTAERTPPLSAPCPTPLPPVHPAYSQPRNLSFLRRSRVYIRGGDAKKKKTAEKQHVSVEKVMHGRVENIIQRRHVLLSVWREGRGGAQRRTTGTCCCRKDGKGREGDAMTPGSSVRRSF